MTMETFDHIVIGAGINGCCTALQLAKMGKNVVLLEQFPLPHSRGSSHGQSRGIRRAYPDAFFTKIMEEAYREWHHIEQRTNTTLIKETGLLCFTDEKDNPFLKNIITSFRMNPGAQHQIFDSKQMSEQFPYLRLGSNSGGCLDPTGGVIMADKALRAVQDVAVQLGVQIHDGAAVCDVQHTPAHVTVTTNTGRRYRAQSCVICAGPWAGSLLQSVGLSLPLVPMKIPVYYWQADNFLPHTFIYEGRETEHIWGLPAIEYPNCAKICLHKGPTTNPDTRDSASTEDMKNYLKNFIREKFPGVVPEVVVEESCMYTVTPDSNPVIDIMPGTNNIVLGVGFSGTGFKTAPVMGRLLAELATGKTLRQEEPLLAIGRFLNNKL